MSFMTFQRPIKCEFEILLILKFTLTSSTNVPTATGTQNFEELSKNVENKHLPVLKK